MQPLSNLAPPPPSQARNPGPTTPLSAPATSTSKFWSIPAQVADTVDEFRFGKSVNNGRGRTGETVGTVAPREAVDGVGGSTSSAAVGGMGGSRGVGRQGLPQAPERDLTSSDGASADAVGGAGGGDEVQHGVEGFQAGTEGAGHLKTPTPFLTQHRLPPTASMSLGGGARMGLFSSASGGAGSSGVGSTKLNQFRSTLSRPQAPPDPLRSSSPTSPATFISNPTNQIPLAASALDSSADIPDTPFTPAVKRTSAAVPGATGHVKDHSAQPQRGPPNAASRTTLNDNPRKRAPSSPPPVPGANSYSIDRGPRIVRSLSSVNEQNVGAQAKKVKSGDGVDLYHGITEMMRNLDKKDSEIAFLKSQIVEKSTEAAKATAEKHKIKHESITKLRLALSNADAMQAELRDSATAMRSAFLSIGNELGGIVAADEIKEELVGIKTALKEFEGPDGTFSIEREERTKLPVLRSLENEISKRQAVIDLLREQLATRTGEISEARDRVNQLEDQANIKLKSIDHYAERLSELEAQLEKRITHGRELEEVRDKMWLLEGELEETKGTLKAREKELEQFRTRTSQSKEELDALVAIKKELTAEVSRLVKEVTAHNVEHEELLTLRRDADQTASEVIHLRQRLVDGANSVTVSDSHHEKVVQGFTQIIEGLKFQSSAKDLLVVDAEERLARLTTSRDQAFNSYEQRLASSNSAIQRITDDAEERVSGLRAREKELLAIEAELRIDLRLLYAKLPDVEGGRGGSGGSDDEIRNARMQAAALRTTIASLETNNANLRSENASLLLNADPSLVSNLRIEHARLTASEGLLRSKLEELESKQATLVQTTAASTFQNCQEGFKRELALKSNELKRANNRLDECNKKLQKVLTELAIAKNRPLIDAHVTSSSPDNPVDDAAEHPTRSSSRNTVHFAPVVEIVTPAQAAAPAVVTKPSPPSTLSDLNASPSSEDIVDFSYEPAAKMRESESPITGSSDDVEVVPESLGRGALRRRSATLESTTNPIVTASDAIEEDKDEDEGPTRAKARPVKTTYASKKRK